MFQRTSAGSSARLSRNLGGPINLSGSFVHTACLTFVSAEASSKRPRGTGVVTSCVQQPLSLDWLLSLPCWRHPPAHTGSCPVLPSLSPWSSGSQALGSFLYPQGDSSIGPNEHLRAQPSSWDGWWGCLGTDTLRAPPTALVMSLRR